VRRRERPVPPRRRNLVRASKLNKTYLHRFILIYFTQNIIYIDNNRFRWPSFKNIIICPVRQETVKPLNCVCAGRSRERKSRGHTPSPRARSRGMSTGTLPPAAARITHIFVCYFILSIDSGALDLGTRKTAATNRPTPDGCERLRRRYRGRIPRWRHGSVCHSVGEGCNSPPTPPHTIVRFSGAWVVVFHFGDRVSFFVLYKGSSILIFDQFCIFSISAFSSFIIFYFSWSRYAFSNIIPYSNTTSKRNI